MLSTRHMLAAALAVALMAPGAALAADAKKPSRSVFSDCDGYGAPTGSGDGMTEMAFTWGIFRPELASGGNTLQTKVTVGAAGLTACDAALTHPDLLPKYWLRRASLLRARAVHELAVNKPDAALADLDEVDAIGKAQGDAFYRRSVIVGANYVRAYALREKGDAAAGEALVLKTLAERPYNKESTLAARLALGSGENRASTREAGEAVARMSPRIIDPVYLEAFDEGRFQDVIDLFDQLQPPKKPPQNLQYDFEFQKLAYENEARAEYFKAVRTGNYAYALAATGHADEGRAAIQKARDRLAEASKPPEPKLGRNGKPKKPNWLDEYHVKLMASVAKDANEALDGWSRAIDLRVQAESDPTAAFDAFSVGKPIKGRAGADILETIRLKSPPASRDATPSFIEAWNKDLEKDDEKPAEWLTTLMQTLPKPEVADQAPPYREAKRPFLSMKGSYNDLAAEGYREDTDEKGVTTIRVRTLEGSQAVIEEMAVLRAAELALAAGKKGFIVVDRRDTRHSIASTYYGMVMNTTPDGSSTELDVIFVDPEALPAGYEHAGWRVVDAAAARAALAPIYPPPAPKVATK